MKRILILFFFFPVGPSNMFGQSPYVQVISDEKGFGRSTITCMMQDHQGILWVGTYLGLMRFDGLETTVYRPEKGNPNSISSEFIYDMFEDDRHRIWLATRNGLSSLDRSRKKFTRFFMDSADSSTLPNNRIFSLLPDTDSTFFLICDQSELSSFNMHTGKVDRLKLRLADTEGHQSAAPVYALRIVRTPNGKILVFTRTGLYEYFRQSGEIVKVTDTHTAYDTMTIKGYHFAGDDGTLWFGGSDNSVYAWVPDQSLRRFPLPDDVKGGWANTMNIQDFDRQHMLVSLRGAYLTLNRLTGHVSPLTFRADQAHLLYTQSYLWNQVSDCVEMQGGIVVMAYGKGDLFIINPLLQQFNFRNLLPSGLESKDQLQSVMGDCFDDRTYQKRYITHTQDSFFFVEDLRDGDLSTFNKGNISGIEAKWMLDQQGRLWLCNGPMVMEVDRKTHGIKPYYPEVPAQNLFEMVEVRPGRMLVGSFLEGLYWFEPDKSSFKKLPHEKGWIRTQVFSLKLDSEHDAVWIGTVRNGLFRYDVRLDTFVQYVYDSHNPHSLAGDWVRDIAIDSAGDIWFATDPTGLSRFSYAAPPDSAFLNLTLEDGLPSNFIAGLGVDPDGYLWMSSLNGIARLDPRDMTFRYFGKSDGLPATSFNRPNLVMTPEGQMIVGAQSGYIHFQTTSLLQNPQPPALLIRDVVVKDTSRLQFDSQGLPQPLRLRYKENFITIQFSVINYSESELNTVRYMMEGLEENWHTRSGISEVRYTNMPPGEYTFRILASNNDDIWNPAETRIHIVIRPPFWQRTWFFLLLASVAGAGMYGFYRNRLEQSIARNRLIAEKETFRAETEKKLAQLEMTALRAQMNPHFIFNCLNSINRFIIINDNDAASEYLTKFSKLIRQVLDNSRGEKIALAAELETLTLYIDMESLRFADKFQYNMEIDPALRAETYFIQPMLIQPYVENAIWHGLMHRRSRGHLSLRFHKKGDALQVEITDNGVGRVMARQIQDAQLIPKKSHGMKVTAERMSLLSRKLQVPVEARVEDLYDEQHQPTGTRVLLTLPLELPPENTDVPKIPNA